MSEWRKCKIDKDGTVWPYRGEVERESSDKLGVAYTLPELAAQREAWVKQGHEQTRQALYRPIDVMCSDCASIARETIDALSPAVPALEEVRKEARRKALEDGVKIQCPFCADPENNWTVNGEMHTHRYTGEKQLCRAISLRALIGKECEDRALIGKEG